MGRILIVDDEPGVLRSLQRSLVKNGWQVETASSGELALARLGDVNPDVVISDYGMPGMTGDALLEEVQQRAPETVGILLTGSRQWEVAREGINRARAFRLLEKPWDDLQVYKAVSEALSVVEKRREHHRSLRRLEELIALRTDQVLQTLVQVLDLRDTETQWHSRRVALYARRLAEELGVKDHEKIEIIERGSLLHDIGKIGVRDAVLLKPGPLNEEEWVEMKRHPLIGFQLLSRIGFLAPAAEIVFSHHERFDGSGYPRGLRGKEIVLGARIFSIVDAYDAITSDRCYRRGRPYEAAVAEIKRFTGTQFDPEIVEAFCKVPKQDWDEIRLAIERYASAEKSIQEIASENAA
jgi:putative nucleotidyltransferase with HDIG domain